jgi:cytochrome P450 family 110
MHLYSNSCCVYCCFTAFSHYQLQKLIEQRRSEGCENKTDTLSEMIKNVSSNGDRLSDEEIQDQVITLMLSGYETTVGAVCGALYLLPLYPEVRYQLFTSVVYNSINFQ